jgi:hypothetical protein
LYVSNEKAGAMTSLSTADLRGAGDTAFRFASEGAVNVFWGVDGRSATRSPRRRAGRR